LTVIRAETEPQDAQPVHNNAKLVEELNPTTINAMVIYFSTLCLFQTYFSSIQITPPAAHESGSIYWAKRRAQWRCKSRN
jgi:hypothetical protein